VGIKALTVTDEQHNPKTNKNQTIINKHKKPPKKQSQKALKNIYKIKYTTNKCT